MFELQPGYLATVLEQGFRLPAGYLDHDRDVDRIRGAPGCPAGEPTVACNNDLLAANFIDDGRPIWLIDYEYSGNNDPYFELGNIWSECHLSDGPARGTGRGVRRELVSAPRWPGPGCGG